MNVYIYGVYELGDVVVDAPGDLSEPGFLYWPSLCCGRGREDGVCFMSAASGGRIEWRLLINPVDQLQPISSGPRMRPALAGVCCVEEVNCDGCQTNGDYNSEDGAL